MKWAIRKSQTNVEGPGESARAERRGRVDRQEGAVLHGGQRREIVERERRKGRLRLRPWLGSLQGRQSASYPVAPLPLAAETRLCALFPRHPIGGPPLETGPQLRTHRLVLSLSLSLSLFLSLSLSRLLSLCLFLCEQTYASAFVRECREINARVNVTELPCAGSPGFGQAPGTIPTARDTRGPVNEPRHRDDLDNFSFRLVRPRRWTPNLYNQFFSDRCCWS